MRRVGVTEKKTKRSNGSIKGDLKEKEMDLTKRESIDISSKRMK